MDKKDVKVDLGSDKLKAKGLDNLEKLEGALDAADQAVSDKNSREERITELEEQLEEANAAPPVEDKPDNGGGKAPQEWDLGQGGGAENQWQTDQMQGRGYQTLVGTSQAIAAKTFDEKTKPLIDRLDKAEAKLMERDILDSIGDQTEQAVKTFGEDWCNKHQDIAEKKLRECVKEGRPLNKKELLTELMEVKMKEDKVAPTDVKDAVGAAEGAGKFAEGESDAAPSTGVTLEGKSVEELEKILPEAKPGDPIEE